MKMTFTLVTEWLSEQLATAPVFTRIAPESTVCGAAVQGSGILKTDWIYVFDVSNLNEFREKRPKNSIILSDDPWPETDCAAWPEDSSAAVYPAVSGRCAVLEAIWEAFAFYNSWYDNLTKMIRERRSWYELLAEGYALLRNPIILYDRSMKVLAYTRNDGTEDEIWKDTVEAGMARVNTAAETDELMKYIAKLDRNPGPFRHIGQGMTYPFVNCNIMDRDTRRGMVTVIESHAPMTPGQIDLLQAFSDLLALGFQEVKSQRQWEEASGSQLAEDLVAGTITSHDRLSTRLIASRWTPGEHVRLLVFYPALSFMNDMQWRQNYEDLMQCGLNGIGAILRKEKTAIVCLIGTWAGNLGRAVTEILDSYSAAHGLRCGISNVYGDLLDTPHYMTQALAALSLSPERTVFYEDVRYLRMLRRLKSAEYCEDLLHPGVLRLKEIDRESGTEYLETLRCYLRSGMSQTETARKLGIHRTTLIYRLRRIGELTNLDFSDAEGIVHATVSLELL